MAGRRLPFESAPPRARRGRRGTSPPGRAAPPKRSSKVARISPGAFGRSESTARRSSVPFSAQSEIKPSQRNPGKAPRARRARQLTRDDRARSIVRMDEPGAEGRGQQRPIAISPKSRQLRRLLAEHDGGHETDPSALDPKQPAAGELQDRPELPFGGIEEGDQIAPCNVEFGAARIFELHPGQRRARLLDF